MDRLGRRSVETPTLKVGDVEKEREIERRLRELGLWENKRRLEDDVSTALTARIDEQDALSKTLEDCRRRRRRRRRPPRPGTEDARTAVDEIRDVVGLRVVRDCYGQKLAYHVNVLMGCFNRDVQHELCGDGVVVVCGSTGALDDSARLTKELRLQLPPSVDTAALTIAFAAGAVKIRAPYLPESYSPLKSRIGSNHNNNNNNNNNSNGGRPYRFASISPIYSLSLRLNSRHGGPLGSNGSPGTMRSDSPEPDGRTPGSVGSETRSVGDEVQLSPLSPPYPVSEEDGQATQVNNGFSPPDETICRSSSSMSSGGAGAQMTPQSKHIFWSPLLHPHSDSL